MNRACRRAAMVRRTGSTVKYYLQAQTQLDPHAQEMMQWPSQSPTGSRVRYERERNLIELPGPLTPISPKLFFFEEDLSEFSDPQNTVQQIFDHDKKALLRTIRTLLRFASKLKLGDSEYNPDGDYLLDEHLEAREIADRLKRIEYLKSIVNH